MSSYNQQKAKEDTFKLILASKNSAISRNLVAREIETNMRKHAIQLKHINDFSNKKTRVNNLRLAGDKNAGVLSSDTRTDKTTLKSAQKTQPNGSSSRGMFIVNNITLENRKIDHTYRENLIKLMKRFEPQLPNTEGAVLDAKSNAA